MSDPKLAIEPMVDESVSLEPHHEHFLSPLIIFSIIVAILFMTAIGFLLYFCYFRDRDRHQDDTPKVSTINSPEFLSRSFVENLRFKQGINVKHGEEFIRSGFEIEHFIANRKHENHPILVNFLREEFPKLLSSLVFAKMQIEEILKESNQRASIVMLQEMDFNHQQEMQFESNHKYLIQIMKKDDSNGIEFGKYVQMIRTLYQDHVEVFEERNKELRSY